MKREAGVKNPVIKRRKKKNSCEVKEIKERWAEKECFFVVYFRSTTILTFLKTFLFIF